MTIIKASLRTPLEVIELVCPEKAHSISSILLKALEAVPGTVIYAESGRLSWGHAEPDIPNKE